jgi:hypothetical protein
VKTRIIAKVSPSLLSHFLTSPQSGYWYDLSGVDILVSLFDLLQFSEVTSSLSFTHLTLPSSLDCQRQTNAHLHRLAENQLFQVAPLPLISHSPCPVSVDRWASSSNLGAYDLLLLPSEGSLDHFRSSFGESCSSLCPHLRFAL